MCVCVCALAFLQQVLSVKCSLCTEERLYSLKNVPLCVRLSECADSSPVYLQFKSQMCIQAQEIHFIKNEWFSYHFIYFLMLQEFSMFSWKAHLQQLGLTSIVMKHGSCNYKTFLKLQEKVLFYSHLWCLLSTCMYRRFNIKLVFIM